MRNIKFYLLLFILFISSCKKEQSSPYGQIINFGGLSMVDHYFGQDNIKVNGLIYYQLNILNNDSSLKYGAQVNGFFTTS